MIIKVTFWDKARLFTPVLIRLMARTGTGRCTRPMSLQLIAQRSGLGVMEIINLSQCTTWDGIDMPTMKAYCSACGMDLCDARSFKRAMSYLKLQITFSKQGKKSWWYLRRHPDWETVYYPLVILWKNSQMPTV